MMLQSMTGGVCTDQVMQAYQIPLTDGCPDKERYWGVPDLNSGQGGYGSESGSYSRVKIVRTLKPGQSVHTESAEARPLRPFSIFHA